MQAPKVAAPKVAAPKVAAPKVAAPKVAAPKVAAELAVRKCRGFYAANVPTFPNSEPPEALRQRLTTTSLGECRGAR
ncbi:hypothetical protein GCM10012319_41480 [Comamonas sp. KCTC 72670]|nr:hypothetical protein GCM10012319_41480 [Comamonas sp. KCTC 72670]